jgi:hypothetical protein
LKPSTVTIAGVDKAVYAASEGLNTLVSGTTLAESLYPEG